jgi:hypothetical protein
MTLVVTFRLHGKNETQKRRASSIKIDGKGALILYDKDRNIVENLTIAELSDLFIESVRSRAARNSS